MSFNRDVDVAVFNIGAGGGAAIDGNLTFVGSAVLNMASDAMLGVDGNIECPTDVSAKVDATAIILGNNECQALEGKGSLP